MSQTPIDYYQTYDASRSEAESPAALQDSRMADSYSVARMEVLPQTTEYMTSTNAIPATCETGSLMQDTNILNAGVDQKPTINAAIAVAMLQTNGDMPLDNNQIMGMIDNQNSAAAAAAAAVAAASSSVQPQMLQNTLQPLAKPLPLRNNQVPPSNEPLLPSQRAYAQSVNVSTALQASPMGVITPSIHGPSTSGSPPQHNGLQMGGQVPQGGIDASNVHGVMDDGVSMPDNNQMMAGNSGQAIMPPVSMPTSVIKVLSGSSQQRPRSEKKPIPEDMKDDKYFERRKRNNQAAKKSRDARKQREDEIAIRASFLEKENAILRAQVATLRDEANSLRQLLLAKRSTR